MQMMDDEILRIMQDKLKSGPAVRTLLTPMDAATTPASPLGDDDLEVEIRVDVPAHRWISVDFGTRDPAHLRFAGMAVGQLALAGNLAEFVADGVVQLPIVDGDEYTLSDRDGAHRIFDSLGPEHLDLDSPQHTVDVRVVPSEGGVLPAGDDCARRAHFTRSAERAG